MNSIKENGFVFFFEYMSLNNMDSQPIIYLLFCNHEN